MLLAEPDELSSPMHKYQFEFQSEMLNRIEGFGTL